MQAVEVEDQQPGLRLHADGDHRRRRQVHASATCRRIRITSRSARRASSRSSATSTCAAACRSTLDLALALAGATETVEVVGHAEDLLERDPDGAHRHRPEPDREAAARVVVRPESGHHAGVAGRRRPTRTGSSIRSATTRRRSSRSTTSRSPISRAASTRTRSRRTPCSRWRSSPASRRPSTATRAASSSTSSPSPASISRSRPAASSFGYGSFKSPTVEVNIGGGSHTVGNFLSVSGMRTDRFLDPPEFDGAARPGQQRVVLQPPRRAPERHRARST